MEPVLDPDNVGEPLALNVDLINIEEHLLKADGFNGWGLLGEIPAPHVLSVCLSLIDRCCKFNTSGLDC